MTLISIFLNRTAVRSSGQRGTEKAVDDRAVRLRLPREFLKHIIMKEIIYDGQACRQGTKNVPAVTLNRRTGRVAISKDAVALLGNPSSVVVIRDAEHPTDWFIRPAKVGYVLNVYESRKSTSRVFFDRRLAGDVIGSFAVTETSIRMGLAMEPDDEGRYALLYWKYAEKGGAR